MQVWMTPWNSSAMRGAEEMAGEGMGKSTNYFFFKCVPEL